MELIQVYAKELISALVPLLVWWLQRVQGSGVTLVRGVRHAHTFLVNQRLIGQNGEVIKPTQTAQTASVVILNRGRSVATNVELVLNFSPMCVNFWPLRSYEERVQADGRHSYIFPSLAAGEAVGFELLSVNQDLPALVTVRCDQGQASEVRLAPQEMIPTWKRQVGRFVYLLGLGTLAYLLILLIQFLVLKTP